MMELTELATMPQVKKMTKFRESRILGMATVGLFPSPSFKADDRPLWLMSDIKKWLEDQKPERND